MFDRVRSSEIYHPRRTSENLANERLQTRRSRLSLKFGAAALAISAINLTYWSDVDANRALSSQSQPEINTLGEPSPELLEGTPTFYLAGFDTMNGDVFGERVGMSIQEIMPGISESINYGDAPLDPTEIAKKIIGYAEAKDHASIALAGNSLGGIIAAEVGQYIVLNSDIQVEAIMLNATPDGREGLHPETQGDLSTMMQWLELIPGSEHSTYAKYAATLLQEKDSYMQSDTLIDGVNNFTDTSSRVWEQVQERRRPGMWLLVDQALAITNADLENIIQTIGEQRGEKRMPVIVSMRSQNPEDDTVVDVEKSSRAICGYAEAAKLACKIVYVKDARHTSYQFDSDAFTTGISAKAAGIKADLRDEAIEYARAKYAHHIADSDGLEDILRSN